MHIKKISINIIIYTFINGLKSLVPFLMVPILTKYLTNEEYGLLSLLEVFILLLFPFISLNASSAIGVEYFKKTNSELKTYISTSLFLNICAFLIVFFIFLVLGEEISQLFSIELQYLLLISFFTLLRVMDRVILTIYQSMEEALKYGFYTISQSILDISLSLIFVIIYSYGIFGRLSGVYISFFLMTIIGVYILKSLNYLSLSISRQYIIEILKFGLPLIPHVLGGVIIAMSDRFFISYYYGNADVGNYTVSYQMGALMLLFGMSINQAWMPILFKKLRQINGLFDKMIVITTVTLGFAFLLICFFIFYFSDIVFHYFVDEKFYEAKLYFPYLLLSFLLQSLYFLFSNFLFFKQKTGSLAIITFICAIVNLILNYFLINYYGIEGVAIATAITFVIYLLLVIMRVFFLYRSVYAKNN